MDKFILIFLCMLFSSGWTGLVVSDLTKRTDNVSYNSTLNSSNSIHSKTVHENDEINSNASNKNLINKNISTHPRFSKLVSMENLDKRHNKNIHLENMNKLDIHRTNHQKSDNYIMRVPNKKRKHMSEHKNRPGRHEKLNHKSKHHRKNIKNDRRISKNNKRESTEIKSRHRDTKHRKSRNHHNKKVESKFNKLEQFENINDSMQAIEGKWPNNIKYDSRAEFLRKDKKLNDYRVLAPFIFSGFWEPPCPKGEKPDRAGICRPIW